MSLRVGYFPNNNSLFVLRHLGILERVRPDVEWVDLRTLDQGTRPDVTQGLPSLHADRLFDGGYDFIGTGFTPPITGQANGHDLVYAGVSRPRVENGRLLTKADSGISGLADLRGRRVGIAHGSWQTTLLLFALDKVGLTWRDIVPVDTAGAEAAEAFLSGGLDAWVGAYPALSRVEEQVETRDLVPTDGLFSHPSLWFTRREFAENRRADLAAILAALQEADAWVRANTAEAAALFAEDAARHSDGRGESAAAWEHALRTRPFGVHPVDPDFVAEQQRAADLLHANGLLPRKVDVSAAVLPDIAELIPAVPTAA